MPKILTKDQIQRIQQLIRDRFSFIAAQMESDDFTPQEDVLERWKERGWVSAEVTPEAFALAVPGEMKMIRNAFVFGRLHQAVERGRSYEQVLKLALELPLLKPDRFAIAVAEQQAATHITALGDDIAAEFGRLAAARSRDRIREMAVKFHARELPASVRDRAAKEALGMEIPEGPVETWQGLSSELYHAMQNKARDWDRIAFYETEDAARQGQAMEMLARKGAQQLVYKLPMPDACPQCKHLYLAEDGHPKVFRLEDMLSFGTNIGRKNLPVRGGVVSGHRNDGEPELLPVAGLVHPWCRCQLFPLTGLEPWLKNRKTGEPT